MRVVAVTGAEVLAGRAAFGVLRDGMRGHDRRERPGRAADRRQQVAEVVRDTADEAAERFLFLRVIELGLERLTVG